ncbi:adenosylcobinamide-GDP ribazoletransferase [Companilactobacillus versmoldensis]|uniref:Adenosylcobinamide-GDP ribazoletransferase n=2 Tax=Companilactobacillus versmoldensis TaxID=194326 RepID=A0A0R1SPL6_9LACO|nr:cobalamin-5-phosphate synthase [Companilactobacillus versmoldensis DSM 14857 = KCTC 3814]
MILYGQFFTRVPIPIPIDKPQEKFNQGIQYLTLFGLLLGAIEALCFYGLSFLFPTWLCWIFLLVIDGMITGGFHLDALADTADGLFSSRDKDKMYQIMKDSRLGTMGALALIYYYVLMIGTTFYVSSHLSLWTNVFLAAITIMNTKTGVALVFLRITNSQKEKGLLKSWGQIEPWRAIISQVVSIIVIFLGVGYRGLIAYLAAALFVLVYKKWINHQLGGFTGDTLGAYASICQVVFLIVFAAVVKL